MATDAAAEGHETDADGVTDGRKQERRRRRNRGETFSFFTAALRRTALRLANNVQRRKISLSLSLLRAMLRRPFVALRFTYHLSCRPQASKPVCPRQPACPAGRSRYNYILQPRGIFADFPMSSPSALASTPTWSLAVADAISQDS